MDTWNKTPGHKKIIFWPVLEFLWQLNPLTTSSTSSQKPGRFYVQSKHIYTIVVLS